MFIICSKIIIEKLIKKLYKLFVYKNIYLLLFIINNNKQNLKKEKN